MRPTVGPTLSESDAKLTSGWIKVPLPARSEPIYAKQRLYCASDNHALAQTAIVNAVHAKGRVLLTQIPKAGLESCIQNTPFLLRQGNTLELIGQSEAAQVYQRVLRSFSTLPIRSVLLSSADLSRLIHIENKLARLLIASSEQAAQAEYFEDLTLMNGFFCRANAEPKTALGQGVYTLAQRIPELIQRVDFRQQLETQLNEVLQRTTQTGQVHAVDLLPMRDSERKTVMSAVSNLIYTVINFRLYDPAPPIPSNLLNLALLLNDQLHRPSTNNAQFLVSFQDFFSRNRIAGSTQQALKLSGSHAEGVLYESLIQADRLCHTAPLHILCILKGLIEGNVPLVESAVKQLYQSVVHELWNLFAASDSRGVDHRYNPLQAAKSMFSLGTTRDSHIIPVISGAHSMSVQFLDALFARTSFQSTFGVLQHTTPLPHNYRMLLNLVTQLNLPQLLRAAPALQTAQFTLDHAQRELMQIMQFHRSRMALVIMLAEKVGRKTTSAGNHEPAHLANTQHTAHASEAPHQAIGKALQAAQQERVQPSYIAAQVQTIQRNAHSLYLRIQSPQLLGYHFVPGDRVRLHLTNHLDTISALRTVFQFHLDCQIQVNQLPKAWRDALKVRGQNTSIMRFSSLLPFVDLYRIHFLEANHWLAFSDWSQQQGSLLNNDWPSLLHQLPIQAVVSILRPIERTVSVVCANSNSVEVFVKNNHGYLAQLNSEQSYPIELLRSRVSPPSGSPAVFAMGTATSVAARFCQYNTQALVFISLKHATDQAYCPEIKLGKGGQLIVNVSQPQTAVMSTPGFASNSTIPGRIDQSIVAHAPALTEKILNGEKIFIFGSHAFAQSVKHSLAQLIESQHPDGLKRLNNALYVEGYSDVSKTVFHQRERVLNTVFHLEDLVTSSRCLLLMNGLVFDLEHYKTQHWGGQELLDMLANTESTQAYQCITVHEATAESDLFNCLVGLAAPDYQTHPQQRNIQQLVLAKNIFRLDFDLGQDELVHHAYYQLRSLDACRRAEQAICKVFSVKSWQALAIENIPVKPIPSFTLNHFGDIANPQAVDIEQIVEHRQAYQAFIIDLFDRCLMNLLDV